MLWHPHPSTQPSKRPLKLFEPQIFVLQFSGLLSAAKDFDAAATTSQVKARMEKELEARKLAEEQQVLLAGGGESSSSSASSSTSSSSSSTSAAAPKSEVPSIKK